MLLPPCVKCGSPLGAYWHPVLDEAEVTKILGYPPPDARSVVDPRDGRRLWVGHDECVGIYLRTKERSADELDKRLELAQARIRRTEKLERARIRHAEKLEQKRNKTEMKELNNIKRTRHTWLSPGLPPRKVRRDAELLKSSNLRQNFEKDTRETYNFCTICKAAKLDVFFSCESCSKSLCGLCFRYGIDFPCV